MIKIENNEVTGWESAIRGMRNPMNSWEKSDSEWTAKSRPGGIIVDCDSEGWEELVIGPNDQKLMTKLRNAGTDHRKFMRMITVYLDITAPLYWWKEFDTYKVGTVANSCSTMHKIADKEFTEEDFSFDHIIDEVTNSQCYTYRDTEWDAGDITDLLIGILNHYRELYLQTKEKKYWWQMIQLLPSSYNQRRTVMLNYEVLANIYKSRKNHKLDEWCEFCKWIESLSYSEIIIDDLKDDR